MLDKNAESWFFVEYSILSHVLILWIEGSKCFRKIFCGITHHKSYDLVLKYYIEISKSIVYILWNPLFSYTDSFMTCCVWCRASKSWKIPISWKFSISWISTGILNDLMQGLPYPRKSPYRGKIHILYASLHFFRKI